MLATNRKDLWTPDEIAFAVATRIAGWTLTRIGDALGRSPKGVFIRLKLAGVKGPKTPGVPCRHCKRVLSRKARGLCFRCFGDKGIRLLYPAVALVNPHEPTEAELDALIARQRQCLPPWWHREAERVRQVEGGGEASAAALRETSAVRRRGVGLSREVGL